MAAGWAGQNLPGYPLFSCSARNGEQPANPTLDFRRVRSSASPLLSANNTSVRSSESCCPLLRTAAQHLLSSLTHGPIRLPSSRKITSPGEDSIDILSIEFQNRYEVADAKLLRQSSPLASKPFQIAFQTRWHRLTSTDRHCERDSRRCFLARCKIIHRFRSEICSAWQISRPLQNPDS
jgi:hypothetical protein